MSFSPDDIRELVACGIREFNSVAHDRKISIVGYDLDDECKAYAQIWGLTEENYEYIDSVDLSCLEAV